MKKPSGEPDKVPAYGVMKSAAAGEKVTVACKLPNGLILELDRIVDDTEPVLGGGFRAIKRALRTGHRVEIAGTGYPVNMAPLAPILGAREPGSGEGFALTPGVDADFWNAWCAQNEGSPLLQSGVLFAHIKQVFVEGEAKEKVALRSGLEPMHRNGSGEMDDLRAPRPLNGLIGKVSTERAAA